MAEYNSEGESFTEEYDEMTPEQMADAHAAEIDAVRNEMDFLEEAAKESPAESILKDVSEKAKHLLELKWAMEETEDAYLTAKKQYDEFRCVTLPTFMKMSGMTLIETLGGARVEVVAKYYCKPNKNAEDMKTMVAFLKEHEHEDIVQRGAVVGQSFLESLEEHKIPYIEVEELNTNTLKAWLKDQVGGNGGQIHFKMEDIPKCFHFVRMEECEILV